MSDPRTVRVNGPLMTYAEGFVAELLSCGYTPDSASAQVGLMAHVSRWLARNGLGVVDLTPSRAEQFLSVRRAEGYTNLLSPRALVQLLDYLAAVSAVSPAPATTSTQKEELLERYHSHLIVDRGLSPRTVVSYLKVAQDFLADREMCGSTDLASLTAGDVSAYVVRECRQRHVPSAKSLVTGVRSLLRFLHAKGFVPRDLSGAVPGVAGWKGGRVPRSLDPSEVEALLASVDTITAVGLRDHAILTTMVRLGLRAGEVAGLRLEDVDWHQGELLIRGKGRCRERLPLPVDVGEAIVAYLRHGRPRVGCRALFIRFYAPVGAMTPSAVSLLVRRIGKQAGVDAAAHRLRHSAATGMLRGGASLAEVGQVLRHTDTDIAITSIYTSVDHGALRALAQPWPGARP